MPRFSRAAHTALMAPSQLNTVWPMKARNELAITLKCVDYNAKRLVWLVSQGAPT